MTGRLIFSIIVITIVLIVVIIFFVLLFKLICCNRRSSSSSAASSGGKKHHQHNLLLKQQHQQMLLLQQQQQQHPQYVNYKYSNVVINGENGNGSSRQQYRLRHINGALLENDDNATKQQQTTCEYHSEDECSQDLLNPTKLKTADSNGNKDYLTVNWPNNPKKNQNMQKNSVNNQQRKKSLWANCKFKFQKSKNSKSNLKKIQKQQQQQLQQQQQQGNRFYIIDSLDSSNIYYLYNPNIQRRLSVITEERTSALSSRSNSTDKTHAII